MSVFQPFQFVTVWIDGGRSFWWLSGVTNVFYRPGTTVYDALNRAGVDFIGAQIIAINGFPIPSGYSTTIILNGQQIPPFAIGIPLRPFDQLVVSIVPVPTLF